MPGKNERKQGSPPRPGTPPRSSPGRLASPDQHSFPHHHQGEHSGFQALPRPTNLVSRTGSSPALNLMGPEAGHRDDAKRKHHPTAFQALRLWRLRPKAMAFLALATLGTLGSLALGSTGLMGLIAGSPGERAARQLASPGVPASLMAANISSAYTQAFCANKGNYLLQGQNWPDAPICQLAPTPVSSGDACADAINVPKVAMMFLAMEAFPHAAMWALWFQQAGGLLPTDCVASAVCGSGAAAAQLQALTFVLGACGPDPKPPKLHEIIDRQHLFNVYVHLPPNKTLSGPPSVFHGREIPGSITTVWGEWTLAEASRVLIRHALKEPLNQRFIMASESCSPLYPPAVVYQQLMYERKSRINACDDPAWYRDNYRYQWGMHPELEERFWRKSFQWFGVVRKHAHIIVEDTKVSEVFKRECWNGFEDDGSRWRICYSDEHYFATVLATKGLDQETDCIGGMTHVEWCNPCKDDGDKLHPRSFTNEEVDIRLLRLLREEEWKGCNVSKALSWAANGFTTAAQLAAGEQCGSAVSYQEERGMLGKGCPLFGRKFPRDTAGKVLAAAFGILQEENTAQPQGQLVPDGVARFSKGLCPPPRGGAPSSAGPLLRQQQLERL